jgi:hypothetical protein
MHLTNRSNLLTIRLVCHAGVEMNDAALVHQEIAGSLGDADQEQTAGPTPDERCLSLEGWWTGDQSWRASARSFAAAGSRAWRPSAQPQVPAIAVRRRHRRGSRRLASDAASVAEARPGIQVSMHPAHRTGIPHPVRSHSVGGGRLQVG